MQKQTLVSLLCILTFFTTFAQANRTFDGSNNNISHPNWGVAHTNLVRMTDIAYADKASAPGGTNRPNPREISNAIFNQSNLINDPLNLSTYNWVWGQFIDHDIDLTGDAPAEFIMIDVPEGDPWFDPMSSGTVRIPMKRSEFDPSTGTSFINPRQHPNRISAYIDASGVYGSDQIRADWLRTFQDGKLKTSAGNLLPFNTTTGQYEDEIDHNAPEMDDAVGTSPKLFVAGDVRANENVLLASFHTLFVREHNRICDELRQEFPFWNDEVTYQRARKIVGALIQNVIYTEWLPAMGIELEEYTGYDSSVNAGIFNIFSAAAFRMGHTLLTADVLRMDNSGNTIPEGNLTLRDAFFNPIELVNGGGVDPLFKGMGTQTQQDLDCRLIDDVRNFLFGTPGMGGLDLAAININRGRERGIPDFNTVRVNFGLPAYTSFAEINSNPLAATELENIYGDINEIDPWVGFLAEEHMAGALFGETLMEIMKEQFSRLRDGDRFYFENDAALSAEDIEEIKNTRLVDIIMRNTGVSLMQGNLFTAMDHEVLANCGATTPNVSLVGTIKTPTGLAIPDVKIEVNQPTLIAPSITNAAGSFAYPTIPACYAYELVPTKDINPGNGVTTYDLVLIQQHILAIEDLDEPYKMIAADANADGSITTFDIVQIRQLILAITTTFPDNTSWRFYDANYVFNNPSDPFDENPTQGFSTASLVENETASFIGVKIGDVNYSVDPMSIHGNNEDISRNDTDKLIFRVKDQSIVKDQEYTIAFRADAIQEMMSYQFTLNFDATALEFINIQVGEMPYLGEGNFGYFLEDGMITTSWNGENQLKGEDVIFNITFKAKETGQLRDYISINSRMTPKEAVTKQFEEVDIALQFDGVDGSVVVGDKFEVYQNTPNPFKEMTTIGFYLPAASKGTIKISDVSGRLIKVVEGDFVKGANKFNLLRKDIANTSGVLYYEVQTDFGNITKKMILLD